MLSMLGFQTAPVPFGRKPHADAHSQANMSYSSRAKTTQSQARAAQGPTYYLFSSSGSYILDSQRPIDGHAGHSSTSVSVGYATQHGPTQVTSSRSEFKTSPSSQQVPSSGDRNNSKNASSSKSFKIYPDTPMLDSFVYERSEAADSDILTCYSNSSVDTLLQFPTVERPTQVPPPSATRRNSVLAIADPSDATGRSTSHVTPDSPHPHPISLPSSNSSMPPQSQALSVPLRKSDDNVRPRSGSGDSGSSRRRSSSSDSERPVTSHPGPSPTRSSPPRVSPGGRLPDRTSVPPNFSSGPRDVPPIRRDSDPSIQTDAARKRRLSGAVIPTGFGVLPGERLSPPSGRDSVAVVPAGLGTVDRNSPPILRAGPHSPDKEVSPPVGFARERRTSGAGVNGFPAPPPGSFYDRDRPALRRGSQSSGSTTSRERQSPQDEAPRGVSFAAGPVPVIRSRTISQSRISKDDVPRPIFVAGLETSKTVRFSENLICPSPIPPGKRRRGWFNKRGDQLWTNDGVFVAPDPGTEYPIDLVDYPEAGAGWQNEEGIRIDMQHRLVPKTPLRPALKRGGSSANSQSQLPLQHSAASRPENRVTFSSTSIREEP